MTTTTEHPEQAVFLYDDCCPLCRGYTATFSGLGWTGRTGFSTVDDEVVAALDFDLARHKIPLYDASTGTVKYGLDGILDVVNTNAPLLEPITTARPVRAALDGFYWMVTYNRRHIVSAPPPPVGAVDCAPDFNVRAVAAYIGLATTVAAGLAAAGGVITPVAASAVGAAALMKTRKAEWNINKLQAAGHVTSVALAAAGAGAAGAAIAGPAVATGLALAAGGRKLHLRRWVRQDR